MVQPPGASPGVPGGCGTAHVIPVVCKSQAWWHGHERWLVGIITSPGAVVLGVVVVVAVIWSAWHQSALRRGKDVIPAHQAASGWLRFSLIEDAASWRALTAVLLVVAGGCWMLGWRTGGTALGAGALFVGLGRWGKVQRARRQVLAQMLDVAAANLRYPRPSVPPRYGPPRSGKGRRVAQATPVLRVSEWVEVADWRSGPKGEILPGKTVVRYPPAFGAGSGKAREGFERQWDVSISSALEWTYDWSPAGNAVVCVPSAALPTFVAWRPDPKPVWNLFPTGVGPEGVVHWDVLSCPHSLVAGPTGSGKSVAQRVMAAHALLAGWEVYGLDPKRVELGWLKGLPGVQAVASDFEDMAELVSRIEAEMHRRTRLMAQEGVNDFRLLTDPPPPILVMIDEVTEFLSPTNLKSPEAKAEDELRAYCATKIQSMGRLSRAAGISLLLATQRPDAAMGFSGNLKNNLDARLACGRMDEIPSRMVLDSDAARWIPPIKGRGLLRQGGGLARVQVFYCEGEDVARAAKGRGGSVRESSDASMATELEPGERLEKAETKPALRAVMHFIWSCCRPSGSQSNGRSPAPG